MFTRDRVYPIQPLAKLDDVCLNSRPTRPSLARTDVDSSRLKILVTLNEITRNILFFFLGKGRFVFSKNFINFNASLQREF